MSMTIRKRLNKVQIQPIVDFFKNLWGFVSGEFQTIEVSAGNHTKVIQLIEEFIPSVELGESRDWFVQPTSLVCDKLICVNVETESSMGQVPIEVIVLRFHNRGEMRIGGTWMPAPKVVSAPTLKIFDDRIEILGFNQRHEVVLVVMNRTTNRWDDCET